MNDPSSGNGLEIDIRRDGSRWDADFAQTEPAVHRAAVAALDGVPRPAALNVLLTGDAEITKLNMQWRDKNGPTNVLSFPSDESPRPPGEPLFLGDIAVARETLEREALRDDVPFVDHLAHLIVHGVLHLRGYDHETEEEAVEMEGRETALLAALGVADPYDADLAETGVPESALASEPQAS